jgi:hypothetical protein
MQGAPEFSVNEIPPKGMIHHPECADVVIADMLQERLNFCLKAARRDDLQHIGDVLLRIVVVEEAEVLICEVAPNTTVDGPFLVQTVKQPLPWDGVFVSFLQIPESARVSETSEYIKRLDDLGPRCLCVLVI